MAMSLEAFAEKYGRYPSADWFTGQRVVTVPDGAHDGAWAIEFEGGGCIVNHDPLVPNPGIRIVGQALSQVVMTSKVTELRFGLEQVKLTPIHWAMMEPSLTMGEMVFAQRSEFNMPPEVRDAT